jgi:lambda repressor-like predicted transcriptional regulator
MRDGFREQFLEALERSGMTLAELSRRSGVKYDALNKLKSREGASTSAENAARIARALGFEDQSDLPLAPAALTVAGDMVDIYNVEASAGFGAVVGQEMVVDRLSFPPGYLRQITSSHPKNLAIIGVKGKSMEPTLSDDDIVMVDLSKTDLSYDGLFVVRDGGDSLLVKRISRGSRRGTVMLVSDNPQYPNQERSFEDVEVVGKVIWKGVKE